MAQSFHKLKVAFNNAFRMMHNLPMYCSASEMFTVNRVADCKAVIRNLVHCFIMRMAISKHLLVRSILSSDLVCSSRIMRHWASYCMSTIMVDDKYIIKPCAVKFNPRKYAQTASVAEWLRAWDTLTMFEATVCGRY